MSDEVQVTPELLDLITTLAAAVPSSRWIPRLGSGSHICTSLVSESEEGERFWLADFDPDYFHVGRGTRPLPDHRAMLSYVLALHPSVVLALVSRIRELEKENEEMRDRAKHDGMERSLRT